DLLMRAGLASCRARVRLSMTGGSGSLLDRSSGSDRVIWMLASRIAADPDSISAEFATFPRNEKSPLVGLKCASYAENLLALDRAQRRGFDESLFFNTSGHLCEFATGNVFLVSNQRLLTPSLDTGCLPGVARAVVIRLASAAGMECSELHLRRADLDSADEVFLTSALRGPLAVKRIENREMPVQLITNQLRRQWKDAVFEQNAL
ncbi:MAG: aminotransferase class IV, partial [Luteolibacter sp.]